MAVLLQLLLFLPMFTCANNGLGWLVLTFNGWAMNGERQQQGCQSNELACWKLGNASNIHCPCDLELSACLLTASLDPAACMMSGSFSASIGPQPTFHFKITPMLWNAKSLSLDLMKATGIPGANAHRSYLNHVTYNLTMLDELQPRSQPIVVDYDFVYATGRFNISLVCLDGRAGAVCRKESEPTTIPSTEGTTSNLPTTIQSIEETTTDLSTTMETSTQNTSTVPDIVIDSEISPAIENTTLPTDLTSSITSDAVSNDTTVADFTASYPLETTTTLLPQSADEGDTAQMTGSQEQSSIPTIALVLGSIAAVFFVIGIVFAVMWLYQELSEHRDYHIRESTVKTTATTAL